MVYFRCLLRSMGFIKNTSSKELKFYSYNEISCICKSLNKYNIISNDHNVITFSDSLGNGCVDTSRDTDGCISLSKERVVDYESHFPVLVNMSSGEAECISAAITCEKASHLRMLMYGIIFLSSEEYECTD